MAVMRDSHYLFSTPYRELEWFFGAKKKKKTVLEGLRLKKQQWEMRDCPWHHNCTGTGYSSTVLFWLFQEINGDKVAAVLVCKSADNEQGNIVGRDSGILGWSCQLIFNLALETQQKVSWLEEIELNFDASFQQILTSELKILWEALSTPTLVYSSFDKVWKHFVQKQISILTLYEKNDRKLQLWELQ
jgi:hypothetical protein